MFQFQFFINHFVVNTTNDNFLSFKIKKQKSQGNGIMLTGDDDGHTLDGSVQKRLRAFSTAYYNRFGNPDMNSKKEPILPSSSQREQIA